MASTFILSFSARGVVDDLKESGFNATMIALEIGCRGVVDLRNNANDQALIA